MNSYDKPLPELTRLNGPYFEGAAAGELRLQRCDSCGRLRFPPSTHCPDCLSDHHSWVAASGRGKVWSFIVMHQRYFKAFAADLPYNVAMIQLEEGPILMSTVVGIPNGEITCDMRVQAVFEQATEQIYVPKFRPAEAS